MQRVFRSLAGSLMLVALTLSITQSVWASICAPAESPASTQQAPAEDCHRHGTPAPEPSSDGSNQTPAPCPFTPFSIGGSCVSAATPAPALALQSEAPPHDEAALASAPDAHDLFLTSSLFHPPRA